MKKIVSLVAIFLFVIIFLKHKDWETKKSLALARCIGGCMDFVEKAEFCQKICKANPNYYFLTIDSEGIWFYKIEKISTSSPFVLAETKKTYPEMENNNNKEEEKLLVKVNCISKKIKLLWSSSGPVGGIWNSVSPNSPLGILSKKVCWELNEKLLEEEFKEESRELGY
jgi:hypothetical protein